jgi:hypothetical protein
MATDKEIQDLIGQGEAGVQDVIRAYEVAERRYFAASAQVPLEPVVVSGTSNTSAPPTR